MWAHHGALLVGYSAGLIGWFCLQRRLSGLWPASAPPNFARPWTEVAWALVAAAGILLIGQLYQRRLLIPESGVLEPLLESVNQILIFSPLVVLLVLRRQSPSTAWVPTSRVWMRIGAGLLLAALAMAAFTLVRTGSAPWWRVIPRVYRPSSLPIAVQVFLEDCAIATLLVRIGAATGRRQVAAVAVAALFALGHVPAILTREADLLPAVAPLALDFLLAVGALLAVQRSADIWWFWCIHFAMDMMQFESVTGISGSH